MFRATGRARAPRRITLPVAAALAAAAVCTVLLEAGTTPASAAVDAIRLAPAYAAEVVAVEADGALLADQPERRAGADLVLPVTADDRALLRFTVPARRNAVVTGATLQLTGAQDALPGLVVRRTGASWDEATVSASTAPALGAVLGTTGPGTTTASVDVTSAVAGTSAGGPLSLAVSASSGAGALVAREGGPEASRLLVEWTYAEGSGTRFGTSNYVADGETAAEAFQWRVRAFGQPGVVRVYSAGMPTPWSSLERVYGSTPLHLSFKADPRAILTGTHDAALRSWFANAPRDRETAWTYFHEPEDDIRPGSFTHAEYRAAWARIARLADEAANPQLRATLVLMCWTLDPHSGRRWTDFYQPEAIDVLGWDCYDAPGGGYVEPAALFGPAAATARAAGRPWLVAEWGALVESGNASGRATWIRRVAQYLSDQDALSATYWDAEVPGGGDYRVRDAAGMEALRAVQEGQ